MSLLLSAIRGRLGFCTVMGSRAEERHMLYVTLEFWIIRKDAFRCLVPILKSMLYVTNKYDDFQKAPKISVRESYQYLWSLYQLGALLSQTLYQQTYTYSLSRHLQVISTCFSWKGTLPLILTNNATVTFMLLGCCYASITTSRSLQFFSVILQLNIFCRRGGGATHRKETTNAYISFRKMISNSCQVRARNQSIHYECKAWSQRYSSKGVVRRPIH